MNEALAFNTIDLRIREQDSRTWVEVVGPEGEWVEAETQMPKDSQFETIDEGIWNWPEGRIDSLCDSLGRALMPPDVQRLYAAVLDRTLSQGNQVLRLKVHFLGAARGYQRYPWEGARVNGQYPALTPRVSFTRTTDLPRPAIPFAVDKLPYRILVATVVPSNLGLDPMAGPEVQSAEATLRSLVSAGLLQLEVCPNLTLSRLEELLHEKDYHIFYFTGFANVDKLGNGTIVLVDEKNAMREVDARRFASIFLGTRVRIAFLSTGFGVLGRGSGVGLADALLEVGLPIVVGHSGVVTNVGAQVFAGGFFDELVRTNSIDFAVSAGRRAMTEPGSDKPRGEWLNPVLLMRSQEGKFFGGEAAYTIETFIRGGSLVSEAKARGEFDAAAFVGKIDATRQSISTIRSVSDQFKAKDLIDDAELEIRTSNWTIATQKLAEASSHIYLVIKNEERDLVDQRHDRQARWTVLGISVFLLTAVAALAFALRDIWTPDMTIPVIALPVAVVVWSFVGGVAAMLQAFVGTKLPDPKPISYEWLLWRPVVGVILGSVVYLVIAGGLFVLGQVDVTTAQNRNTYVLWALAFLGGFSDKFAILVFDTVVRTVAQADDKAPSGVSDLKNESHQSKGNLDSSATLASADNTAKR